MTIDRQSLEHHFAELSGQGPRTRTDSLRRLARRDAELARRGAARLRHLADAAQRRPRRDHRAG